VVSRALPWTDIVAVLGEARLVELREAMERNRVDALDRDAFLLDGTAGNLLRDLMPEDAPAETVNAYGTLLHMLYLAWSRGWPVAAVQRDALHAAITSATLDPLPSTLSPMYVQFPENLVWAQPVPGAPHEPVDGAFLLLHEDRATVLAVLGFRAGREGFTTAEAAAALPLPPLLPRRDGTAPFASRLPAGDRAGLVSLADEAELVSLVLLAAAAARR
jgi:hypothetical protein